MEQDLQGDLKQLKDEMSEAQKDKDFGIAKAGEIRNKVTRPWITGSAPSPAPVQHHLPRTHASSPHRAPADVLVASIPPAS